MNFNKIVQLTGHRAAVFALAEGRDAGSLLSAGGDGWIVEWTLAAPDPGRLVAKVDAHIYALCFIKKEEKIVAGDMNGGVYWIDLAAGGAVTSHRQHRKGVFGIREHGSFVLSAGGDGCLTKWEPATSQPLESMQLSHQSLRCMDVCESRREMAVGSSDGSIYLLDTDHFVLKKTLHQAHSGSVFSVKYSPDGAQLLSGGRDALLKIRTLGQPDTVVFSEPAHWYTINDIVFHPLGHLFATASRDKTIKIWNADTFELIKVLEGARDGGHFHSVNRLYWADYENTLISCSDDRTLILWRDLTNM